jgi:hypothetical protein
MSSFLARLTGRRKKNWGRANSRAAKTVSIYLENHSTAEALGTLAEEEEELDEDVQVCICLIFINDA